MIGSALVLQGDALSLPLSDASVDLIVTSPPYFALRSYRDGDEHFAGQIGSEATPAEFLTALWAATREMMRVLKASGSIFVNLGDKYAGSGGHNNANFGAKKDRGPGRYNQDSGGIPAKSLMGLPWRYANGCVDQLGLILRRDLIWNKPNGLPESVTDRCRSSHEYWFHLVKQGRYFAAVDEVREPYAPASADRSAAGFKQNGRFASGNSAGNLRLDEIAYGYALNPLGKLPGSVWTIPSEPLLVPGAALARLDLPDHFAAFPQEWPRRLILGWSPSGICVECGEGRRPVVDVERERLRPLAVEASHSGANGQAAQGGYRGSVSRRVTGYACACPEPTAPTRPAVVLDPFGGTGTVAMVARALGRTGISVDLSHDYGRLARWRILESGHQAKTTARFWRERQESLL